MFEVLDVRDAHRVLEIGTGSGYNCALLCQRLGSAQVTSVDIDPELVDLAGERLVANDYTPTLAVADGTDGYPAGAPYDRFRSGFADGGRGGLTATEGSRQQDPFGLGYVLVNTVFAGKWWCPRQDSNPR